MRVAQQIGARGSLKWIQRAVNDRPFLLSHPAIGGSVDWVSPLAADDYAEDRDGAFLDRGGLSSLSPGLDSFWPQRGPQWDALGLAGETVVLVEAKAHLAELFSTCSAGDASRALIRRSFSTVRAALGAEDGLDWCSRFYQYANRLSHLWLLREQGVDARLLLVGFVNDADVRGPTSAAEWIAAYRILEHALGLPPRHALSDHILHVFPDVRSL